MSLFGRKEKEGDTATSVALAEEPGAITKPKLMSHTIIQSLSRAKLAAVTHYVALIETGAVPNDPEYISNFYRNLVPGDVEGMAPKSTLNALRRDTGGLASWVADISTVATVVFRVDPFRNIVFAKAEKRIAAATQWKNEIDEALAVGEIVRASAMLVEPLLVLASGIEDADEENGIMRNLPLAGPLRVDAEKFGAGPDQTTGYILSTESASWWGNNQEIWWQNRDLAFVGLRPTGYLSCFD
jgi:hypothetical protein